MKTKIAIVVASFFLLISCVGLGADPVFDGVTVSVWNETRSVLDAQLYIGALKNNVFIPTDSVSLEKIRIKNPYPSYYTEYDRWNPNLNLITSLGSDSAYFFIRFSNQRNALLQYHGILAKANIKNLDRIVSGEGSLSVSIREGYISGGFYDGNSYEGFRFSISNSETELENAKILIGGKKNNNFIATDSILLSRIYSPLSSLNNFFQLKEGKAVKDYYYKSNRWKPNLDLIRAIPSDSCYFKLVLPNGRESLLKNNKGEFAKTEVPIGRVIMSSDGLIQIQIQKDSITGNFLVYNKN